MGGQDGLLILRNLDGEVFWKRSSSMRANISDKIFEPIPARREDGGRGVG